MGFRWQSPGSSFNWLTRTENEIEAKNWIPSWGVRQRNSCAEGSGGSWSGRERGSGREGSDGFAAGPVPPSLLPWELEPASLWLQMGCLLSFMG